MLRRFPIAEHFSASPIFGHQFENAKIREGFAGGSSKWPNDSKPPFGIDECAFLLSPTGGRQHQVGYLCRLSAAIHILDNQKIEPIENVARLPLIDPRMRRVGADDPQAADLAAQHAVENLVVRPTVLLRNCSLVDTQEMSDLA